MFLLKPKYVIPLAIVSGVLTTYGVYSYLKLQGEPAKEDEVVTRQVVVAARDIAVGTALEEVDLMVRQWPTEIVPEGSYEDPDSLQGRVIKTDVTLGEAILTSKLAPEGSGGGIASLIPAGMRALTVAVNVVSGVGGFILPKTRVDILVTVAPTSKKAENTTRTILQNVEVLAVDQTYKDNGDEAITVKSVTLLVTPEDAEKLALAGNEGKLQLALRSNVDAELHSTSGVKMSQLISKPRPAQKSSSRKSSKPKVVKNTPSQKVVEVIRANVRSEIEFEEGQEGNSSDGKSKGQSKK
jgi:pilus assembly protein CpaB